MKASLSLLLALLTGLLPPQADVTAFDLALDSAERSLEAGELPKARLLVMRALERDAKSPRAWGVRARWAEAAGERDEEVYSRHKELRLLEAQKAPAAEIESARTALLVLDPVAADVLGMRERFIAKLTSVAEAYEGDLRPHSAIRVHKEILALDPEHAPSQAAIERLAAAPDPSLAADAKPVDLLAGVSEEWIREHDARTRDWSQRARLERENYVTYTNAGYEVLVRCAEAMEQMNAFYRVFFDFKTDGDSFGRIDLNIFRTRDEYLKLGQGPPVEWSGGHYTGSAVETYISGGFESSVGTLFHEAAHQFVDNATSASGWLNEGLASFFEGCRILPNGTVLMNLPANHRLFPLAQRMERGWMADHMDGMNQEKLSDSSPEKSPTFAIVLENKYEWGPAWYDPTWGVVYFLYNYQDEVDGRYVYRRAFREFIDKSGGRVGEGAIKNFEEVVLAAPQPPIPGFERDAEMPPLRLARTVAELDPIWKESMLRLRDEQSGVLTVERPYLRWALAAARNRDLSVAQEHFEKGLVATPDDAELLLEFASFLADQENTDRATKLGLRAARLIESAQPVDPTAVREVERKLAQWDPKRATLERVHGELWDAARELVLAYREQDLPLMVMDLAWRMEVELGVPGLFEYYAEAQQKSGKTLSIWSLAYNEKDLEGWDAVGETFRSAGPMLDGAFGTYKADDFTYQMLTLDKLTSGDFSMEVEVQAARGEVGFCGLVFGKKDAGNFHALIYFPPKPREQVKEGVADSGFVDLTTFYGSQPKVWRHNPIGVEAEGGEFESRTEEWHKLRIDVSGNLVDAWVDGEYLATQEFPTAEVLRGNFGLVLGPGKARFKEVRFLARHPRDPAARLERDRRLEEVRAESGGSVGGSWLGQVPPFPPVGRWVQDERANWAERGPVPQVLVLWSIQQNDIVPIDGWLRDLAARHGEDGLEIVSVASPNDDSQIETYLASHAFPGAVAVDRREAMGIGDTNELYSTLKFNLPRVLLLDIDGKVVWEGDPGFSSTMPWKPGVESYLDVPLAELVAKRKLRQMRPWLAKWKDGEAALREGRFAEVLPLLRESRDFERGLLVEFDDAGRRLDAFERATADLERTADTLAAEQRQPALAVLVAWGEAAGVAPERKAKARLTKEAKSGASQGWERALKQIEARRDKVLSDDAQLAALIESVSKLEGAFCGELAQELSAASGDRAALEALLDGAPERPARWLAREFFLW
jgi:tetratricopeptide (TPR) repeat protein